LPYRISGSTLTAVARSQLLARWPGTLSRILSGIPQAAQKTERDTSTSSALGIGVLNDNALYKSTHSLTRVTLRLAGEYCVALT